MIKIQKLKYLLFVISILPLTALNIFTNDTFLITYTSIAFAIFLTYYTKIDPIIVILIILNLFIHFLSLVFLGPADFNTFIGYNLRLLAPYFALKFIGNDFKKTYINTAYFLALLSIPFYIVQFINIDIFRSFTPYFSQFNNEIRTDANIFGFFVHTVHFEEPFRNSGFAWEPGGFGFFLGIALLFSIVEDEFTLKRKSIVIFLVGLTTLSTTFYIFSLFFLIFLNSNAKLHVSLKWIIVMPIIIFTGYYVISLPFMLEKIVQAQTDFKNITFYNLEGSEYESGIGRFASFYQNLLDFINYPFGYGVNDNERTKSITGIVISGPVGLSRLLVQWGFWFILFLPFFIKKYIRFNTKNQLIKVKWIFPLSLLLFLFSNPIERDPLFLMLVYMPFIYMPVKKTRLATNEIKSRLKIN